MTASRRRFLQGLLAGGAVASFGFDSPFTWAIDAPSKQQTLSGTQFDLGIGETPVNFSGTRRTATTVNGSVPAPTLHWREGDTVTLRVTNHLKVPSSIHWHGILLPTGMDGVPGLSFDGIAPVKRSSTSLN